MQFNKTELLTQASDLIDRGWSVFPVRDKQPLLKAGYAEGQDGRWGCASTLKDLNTQIMEGAWDKATLVGIATGESGLVVVDLDDGHNWKDVMDLPVTMHGHGGRHLYFKANGNGQGNTQSDPWPKIDLRGEGGYVRWFGDDNGKDIAPWPFKEVLGGARDASGKIIVNDPDTVLADLIEGMGTPGKRHESVRQFTAVMAARGFGVSALSAMVRGHCTVWDKNVENLINSACGKFGPDVIEPIELPESFPLIDDVEFPPMPEATMGNWLFPGSFNIIYSPAGVGKTGLMVEVINRLRAGSQQYPFQCTPQASSVLWVNGDLPPALAGVQLRQYLMGKDIHYYDAFQTNLNDHWERLEGMLTSYDHVIFDTRASLFKQVEMLNADETDGTFMRLQSMIKDGTTVWLLAHANKNSGVGQVASMFGSSAATWYADNIFALKRAYKTHWKPGKNQPAPWEAHQARQIEMGACFTVEHEKAKWGAPVSELYCGWEKGMMNGSRSLFITRPEN